MLTLTVKIGQSVEIPGFGTIMVKERSGRCAKLAFDCPPETEIKLLPSPTAGADRTAQVPHR